MTNKNRFKKISIIIIIIFLFFTFSFLTGFTDSRTEIPLKLNDENILMDDGGDNDGGEEESSGKGLNIEKLIELVEKATMKHLTILRIVLANAPEAAQGGIQRAIDVSIRGSLRAIEVLSKIKPSNKDNGNNDLKKFHIIATCNRGGDIDPKGIQQYSQGESAAFAITADTGYTLLWIRVDNEKLEGISSHSFIGVDSNHTIHAHFKKIKKSSNQNDDID